MIRRLAHTIASIPARVLYGVRAAVKGPESAYLRGEIETLEGLLRAVCAGREQAEREQAERERDALAAEVAVLRARRAYLDEGPLVRRGR